MNEIQSYQIPSAQTEKERESDKYILAVYGMQSWYELIAHILHKIAHTTTDRRPIAVTRYSEKKTVVSDKLLVS